MDIVEHEEWRAIPGLEGYEASSLGRIRSLDRIVPSRSPSNPHGQRRKGKIFSPGVGRKGYRQAKIRGRLLSIHRLVVAAFYGEIPDKLEVNHKDGNKLNNRVNNLEIATSSENNLHAYAIGLNQPRRGELNGASKLSEDSVKRLRGISGRTLKDMANEFGISISLASQIRSRTLWKHVP